MHLILQFSKSQSHLIVTRRMLLRITAIAAVLISSILFIVQAADPVPYNSSADADLLENYVKSKNYTSIIAFDASNIKQYWIDRNVFCQDKTISIVLDKKTNDGFASSPLKIQLANVNERHDCKVEVIAESQNMGFAIMDSKSEILSKSSEDHPFVQYHVTSASFHLEDTPDCSFSLKFSSNANKEIQIKKIILSFSINSKSSFLSSPGVLEMNKNNIVVQLGKVDAGEGIVLNGKSNLIISKKYILVSNNPFESSVKVKNTGNIPARVYVGYAVYNRNRVQLDDHNYPYKNLNNILNVVSPGAGREKIVVDSYPEWIKNCYLALDAKEDLLDVPNTTFANGRIVEVKKLDDGTAEITMDQVFETALTPGSKVRIHGLSGAYLYVNSKVLQPGDEAVLTASISKDESFIQYSAKAFSRGVYSVKPIILTFSVDSDEGSTVAISDYRLSF